MSKKNVYLFQPQHTIHFHGTVSYWLPYSVGMIWSYITQFPELTDSFELKDLIFRREPINDLIDRMEDPAICGFSCYLWNEKYTLAVAERIKERWPDCLIVCGGPQMNASYLVKYKYIDSVVMAEGEEAFKDILYSTLRNEPVQEVYSKARLQELNIPSPYQIGLFDKIVSQYPDANWNATLETNRGCPYACTFCDWGGTTYSKVKRFDLTHVEKDLEWIANNPVVFIVIADANFGMFKDRDLEIAKLIKTACDKSKVESINTSFAKHSSEKIFEIAKALGQYCRGVTVSVQSMNDDTLVAIKRKNLDINNIRHLMSLSEQYDVPTYTESIIGLPEETLVSWKHGMADILEMGQHCSLDVYFAQLIENSELNTPESREKYNIGSVVALNYDYGEAEGGVTEAIEIITSTSTMTTEEILEGYMYSWMIVNFHYIGYTQIYARYCRSICDIPYADFYNKLFDLIQVEGNPLYDHYTEYKNSTYEYLLTGQQQVDVTTAWALSVDYFYKNKEDIYKLGKMVVDSLGVNYPDLQILQENFLYNENEPYPLTVELDFNIEQWTKENTRYEIMSKIKPGTKMKDLKANRMFHLRNAELKNTITKIDK